MPTNSDSNNATGDNETSCLNYFATHDSKCEAVEVSGSLFGKYQQQVYSPNWLGGVHWNNFSGIVLSLGWQPNPSEQSAKSPHRIGYFGFIGDSFGVSFVYNYRWSENFSLLTNMTLIQSKQYLGHTMVEGFGNTIQLTNTRLEVPVLFKQKITGLIYGIRATIPLDVHSTPDSLLSGEASKKVILKNERIPTAGFEVGLFF